LGEDPALQRAEEMMIAIVVKSEVSPKQCCPTPFWLSFHEAAGWPGRSRQKVPPTEALSLLPAPAHGSPLVADTIPPAEVRPDRSRW